MREREPGKPPERMLVPNLTYWGASLENRFNGILEGEVEGLCGEISQHIGQVTSPERKDTFASKRLLDTINNTFVRFLQTALFNHLILVLNQELHSFDGSGGSF